MFILLFLLTPLQTFAAQSPVKPRPTPAVGPTIVYQAKVKWIKGPEVIDLSEEIIPLRQLNDSSLAGKISFKFKDMGNSYLIDMKPVDVTKTKQKLSLTKVL